MLKIFNILFFLLFSHTIFSQTERMVMPFQWIKHSSPAIVLYTVALFEDSTFQKPTQNLLEEGTLLRIVAQTKKEYLDKDQKQKFRWYRVRTQTEQEGWLFGDMIAINVPEKAIQGAFGHFSKKMYHFNNGFENAMLWVGSLEGRDNFYEKDYLNPIYNETYIIITNERGKSLQIHTEGVSAVGKTVLRQFYLHDVTGDSIPELIFEKSNFAAGNGAENRSIEMFGFQAGSVAKIFDESLSLDSPALCKYIDIEHQNVRVAYLDYKNCTENTKSTENEQCIEYVTYSYLWNKKLKQFGLLYEESRSPLFALPKKDGCWVRTAPDVVAPTLVFAEATDKLTVLKQYKRLKKLSNQNKKWEIHLQVKLPNGETGYVLANQVTFLDNEYNDLLQKYYANPPLSPSDWRIDEKFIKLKI